MWFASLATLPVVNTRLANTESQLSPARESEHNIPNRPMPIIPVY
jgi:hypothetical protein